MILSALFATVTIAVTVSALSPPPLPGIKVLPLQNLTAIGKRTSFRYYYLVHSGECFPYKTAEVHISIAATDNVKDEALLVACHTLAKMTRYMPREVFESTSRASGVGIFTMDETLTVYPRNAALADRPQCYGRCDGNCAITCTFDGRKWSTVPGMTNSISLSNMESVLCMKRDIYGGTENIIAHEFAHLVHMNMAAVWRNKISRAYNNARGRRLWQMNSYSMATEYEYFAVASESFLGSITRTDTITTGGMNLCNRRSLCRGEMENRRFLQEHDPMLYEILLYTYTNNDVSKLSGIDPCEKIVWTIVLILIVLFTSSSK